MKYKHIVFDIDGTLIDTECAVLKSFQQTIKMVTGKDMQLEELKFCLGITGIDALKILQIEDSESVMKLWEKNMYALFDTVTAFEGIKELLEGLEELGCKMGIATSKTREQFSFDFDKHGIHQFFGTTICADDTTEHKPKPAPLLKYMELTGARPEEVLYVGDSEYDMQCAKGAGVDFALAFWGTHLPKDCGAAYVPEKPTDLLRSII